MKVMMEEGYNTTPVLKFLYGKKEEFAFRIPPAKARIILKYLKLITKYHELADACYKATKREGKVDFTPLKEFEAGEFASLVKECESELVDEQMEVEIKDDVLIVKDRSLEAEHKIETDGSGKIVFK